MPRLPKHLARGQHAEDEAAAYLENQGMKLVQRNFSSRFGEIDLIMEDRGELVFVEVRHRSNIYYGSGSESISRTKQGKLILTARIFLQKHLNYEKWNCRFDVVSISGENATTWISDAFTT